MLVKHIEERRVKGKAVWYRLQKTPNRDCIQHLLSIIFWSQDNIARYEVTRACLIGTHCLVPPCRIPCDRLIVMWSWLIWSYIPPHKCCHAARLFIRSVIDSFVCSLVSWFTYKCSFECLYNMYCKSHRPVSPFVWHEYRY